jgi:putative phage-type endonuclease
MATDSPVILQSNPWKSKLELWEEKLGLRPPTQLNDAMRRGQELEPEARKLASELLSINFEPCVFESEKYPEFSASLDGFYGNVYILEIKCPKDSTHDDALDDRIPEYYLDQIQHQLLVSKCDMAFYFSYRPERINKPYAIIEVYPDREKQAKILEEGLKFYQDMQTMNPPTEWRLKPREK